MQGKERRNTIAKEIFSQEDPVTGTSLAKKYGVSRQVIVQDIALLRAQGINIVSTAEGYRKSIVKEETFKRAFSVKHSINEIEDELNLIVDSGGNIINVIVSHPIYGEISVDMMINSRRNVAKFMNKLEQKDFVPLMNLTGGEHIHVVEVDDEEILDEIERELTKKGYLI
ncbi:MAG: transcription repressor NadR [Firmicutes bacterium HGW-Firmicutes-7]|nr:MAG: transcription repressor NadR [Firmicutes bacterium HGW-Firmicutes-7]